MIAVLIMGSRYRPVTVWIGATLAFAVHVTVAVAVGRLLQLLPHRWVEGVTAALFAAGSAYLLFVPEKEEEEKGEEEADQARRGLRTVTAAFLVILVGEFGDLTQILTANLAAQYHWASSASCVSPIRPHQAPVYRVAPAVRGCTDGRHPHFRLRWRIRPSHEPSRPSVRSGSGHHRVHAR